MEYDAADAIDGDGFDVDPMHGAELTTAMQAHQQMKRAQVKQNQQQQGHHGAAGPVPGGPAVPDSSEQADEQENKVEEKKDEGNCYECFFGTAMDAHDGTHSTGNVLLDYYYAGDADLNQEPIEIKHNSIERKLIYYAFAWLWCGCYEPKYKITNKYAIGEEWKCCPKGRWTICIKYTDSMAYENVDDIQKRQNCWYHVLSCCGCCCRETCACNDMADIVLIGGDDSHPDGWKLRRIRNATKLYNEVTKIVQDTQKDLTR